MKKVLALILVFVMALGVLASCGDDKPGTSSTDSDANTVKGTVVVGNITELSGDFRFPGWGGSSAGAADQDINSLTVGYSTMETNQDGAYVWNNTAVKSHEEKEVDGNLVITIEINQGLKFSNGADIKAENYLAYILAFSSPVVTAADHPGKAGQVFLGYADFNAYTGEGSEAGKKEFAGVRLLDEYKFSITIDAASGYYPYYFANTYGAVSPADMTQILGEGASIKDDGNGAYITGNWYDKNGDIYAKKDHIAAARYDVTKYPFSGAYVVSKWDEGTKEATLVYNPNFAGNFEGQKPQIETIVYRKIVEDTQLDQFKNGEVDILSGVTGGAETKAALAAVDASNGKFAETHYQRAGYGKIQFDCDFGPTQFASVRQAIAYTINTSEFSATYTGGYGSVVYGPYSPDFAQYKAVKDSLEKNLINYSYSLENAKKALIDDGWVYNSKGEAFVEGQSGVDSVRYKELTQAQVEALDGANIKYKSVENTDGIEYKTVEVNGKYYMPLVINWFGTTNNEVTEMIAAKLVGTADTKALGMVVRSTVGEFNPLLGEIYREPTYGYDGTPKYGMFNLATGWNSSVYDYAYNWSLDPAWFDYSSNKLYDEYDVAFPYDMTGEKLSFDAAMEQSGGKLGMDYLSMAMVYNATTEEEYNKWWEAYILRWNELVPDVPLYSNFYFDIYNTKIQNFKTGPFWSPVDALLYCTVAE